MLGSITPLGERGRGTRWGITVLWFTLGSVAAGAALGAVLGLVGALVLPGGPASSRATLGALAALIAAGAALDGKALGMRLPTARRQVNEEWLARYRGWVYGGGFGVQLGLGFVTVASASAVYLTFVASFLSAAPGWGAVLGGTFGLVRAATLYSVAGVRRPEQLVSVDARLRRWDAPSRSIAIAIEVVLAGLGLAVALA
jgi:hypothetical protein